MCLPLGFLKTWLSITTVATIVMGLSLFIFGIVTNNQIGSVFAEFQSVKNAIICAMIVMGLMIFFIGIIGLIGAWKESGCCVFIYNIFNILLTAIFVLMTLVFVIYFSVVKAYLYDSLHCANESTTFLTLNKNVNEVGNKYMCSSNCTGKTDPTSYPLSVWNPLLNYADLKNGHPNIYSCDYRTVFLPFLYSLGHETHRLRRRRLCHGGY